ncbi:19509_t:CDS:2, partial [Entrophospora sp. SA101]
IKRCFYGHSLLRLLSYVLDLTNYQNSLALYIKSPGPNDTLPLNYVRNIFPGVSGNKFSLSPIIDYLYCEMIVLVSVDQSE